MNLEKAKIKAQESANHEKQRIAVININVYSPRYVLRFMPDALTDDELSKETRVVFIAHPES